MTRSITIRALSAALALALAGTGAAQTAAPAASPRAATAPAAAAAAANADAKRAEMAQLEQQMSQLGQRMAELGRELGDTQRRIAIQRIGGERPGLGVVLGENTGSGVKLSAVTPGGPADKAGLKSGDVVRSIDGRNLDGVGPEAARALTAALRGKQNGQLVRVGYLRDGRSATANVTLAPIGGLATFNWVGEAAQASEFAELRRDMAIRQGTLAKHDREMHKHIEVITEGAGAEGVRVVTRGGPGDLRVITCVNGDGDCDRIAFARAFRFRGLNLTSIDADLGRYFGTENGVLLIAQSDALPGLKSGDVITAVEGRAIDSPREVMRALGGKEAGQKVKLRILRNRVAQEVEVTVPEGQPLDFLPPPPPPPPSPPAPPSGVAPPVPPLPPAPPSGAGVTVI